MQSILADIPLGSQVFYDPRINSAAQSVALLILGSQRSHYFWRQISRR